MSEHELKFGIDVDASSFDSILTLASRAEKLNFDSVWVFDHIYFAGRTFLEPLTTLTAIATKTKNVKIGVCVLDLNRRNPATLAQTISTIDRISGGRFILGVGSGGGGNPAFYGFPARKDYGPVGRMLESIQIIKKFWDESMVSYAGRFYRFQNASMPLKPIQKPHVPIWISGLGPLMRKIAAKYGDGWITQDRSPEICEKQIKEIESWAEKYGRNPKDIVHVYAPHTSIALSRNSARRNIEPTARQILVTDSAHRPLRRVHEAMGYGKPWTRPEDVPPEAVDRCFIFGTPDDCINRIERYMRAGFQHFIFLDISPEAKQLDSLKLYAKVISYFRSRTK